MINLTLRQLFLVVAGVFVLARLTRRHRVMYLPAAMEADGEHSDGLDWVL